ncbi:hypothetical protein BIW11_07640, partial [Tropilaelaps mercedesae]
ILPNGKISVRLKPPPDKAETKFWNTSLVTNALSSDFLHAHAVHMYGALEVNSSDGVGRDIVIADSPLQRSHSRKKRSVLQLASMLKCVSGCSPLAFHGYGCFCGYMGDGSPVDPIDRLSYRTAATLNSAVASSTIGATRQRSARTWPPIFYLTIGTALGLDMLIVVYRIQQVLTAVAASNSVSAMWRLQNAFLAIRVQIIEQVAVRDAHFSDVYSEERDNRS